MMSKKIVVLMILYLLIARRSFAEARDYDFMAVDMNADLSIEEVDEIKKEHLKGKPVLLTFSEYEEENNKSLADRTINLLVENSIIPSGFYFSEDFSQAMEKQLEGLMENIYKHNRKKEFTHAFGNGVVYMKLNRDKNEKVDYFVNFIGLETSVYRIKMEGKVLSVTLEESDKSQTKRRDYYKTFFNTFMVILLGAISIFLMEISNLNQRQKLIFRKEV